MRNVKARSSERELLGPESENLSELQTLDLLHLLRSWA